MSHLFVTAGYDRSDKVTSFDNVRDDDTLKQYHYQRMRLQPLSREKHRATQHSTVI